MMLSFVLMLAIQLFYYTTVFEGKLPNSALAYLIAAGIAIMFQSARFSFGIAGAYEFSKGEKSKGTFGLVFSLALTVFESFEGAEMAHIWTIAQPEFENTLNMVVQAILWLGFALEIRLLTTVSTSAQEHTDSRMHDNTPGTVNFQKASSNGHAHVNGAAKSWQ